MEAITEKGKFESTSSLEELKLRASQVFLQLDIGAATRREYSYRIILFLKFLKGEGFNKNSFLEFKRYLAGREDLRVATKNKYLATTRVFLREWARTGRIPDITANVKGFKQGRKHKKEGLKEEEVAKIVKELRSLPLTPRSTRLKALFCLFALQGFRQIEVVRLNVEDIDLVRGIAHIQGKGQDDKEVVYLQPQTVKALRTYLDRCNIGSGALFKSLSNNKGRRLSTRAIKQEFKVLFKQLGINRSVHGFRHYFITHLLEKGFGVNTVRKFSRHKSLDMLVVYDDEVSLERKKDEIFDSFAGVSVG